MTHQTILSHLENNFLTHTALLASCSSKMLFKAMRRDWRQEGFEVVEAVVSSSVKTNGVQKRKIRNVFRTDIFMSRSKKQLRCDVEFEKTSFVTLFCLQNPPISSGHVIWPEPRPDFGRSNKESGADNVDKFCLS